MISFVKSFIVLSIVLSVVDGQQEPCEFHLTKNITGGHILSDGSWMHEDVRYPKALYGHYDYVLDGDGNRTTVPRHQRGCICNLRHCLQTCCKVGDLVNWRKGAGDGHCREGNGYKKVPVTVGYSNPESVDLLKEFHWANQRPSCTMHFLEPQEIPSDEWYLLHNGSIYMPDDDVLLETGKYCVSVDVSETDNSTMEMVVLKCIDQASAEARFVLLPIGMFFSVPFLMATFFVYAIIPELRNVHGKSLMNYVLGLTVGYSLLATVQFYGNKKECRDGSSQCFNNTVCLLLGYTIYFSFLVSFFWLNTMCFDIFWTFRGVRGNLAAKHNFKFYCLYAWGMPVLLTTLTLIVQYTNGVPDDFKPNIGQGTCFLNSSNAWAEFIYLYSILIVLICSNITFFVITAVRIQRVQRETSSITNQDSSARHTRHSYEKYRFWLYLRLFVVMGVTWSLEVISWVVDSKNHWFYLTDLFNCIQGILIFLLVVWNKKVKTLLKKRFNKFRGIAENDTQCTTTRTGATSSINLKRSTSIPLEPGKLALN